MLVASLLLGLAAAAAAAVASSSYRGGPWGRVGVGVLEGEKEAAMGGWEELTSLKGGLGWVEQAGEVSWQPVGPGSA